MTTTLTNRRLARRQLGMTLIEIMIAVGISAILLTGLLQVLISSKQSYRVTEASARLQENGRFAVGFLAEDVRMAGYTGCYSGAPTNIESILNTPNNFNWNFNNNLEGNEAMGGGAWSPALDASLAGQVTDGTDVIVMRGLADDGISLVDPYSDSGQVFVDPAVNNVNVGDILMVTDCSQASMFQVTNEQLAGGKLNIVHSNGGGPPGNTGPLLGKDYGADAQLARFVTNVYFIGTGASGEPALFRQTLGTAGAMVAQELVEGVENMQILYGEDTDADDIANRYVTADNVADMTKVASVRISLLLRTDDAIASAAQTYAYDGANVTAGDLRIRRVFTTTVKLRNRGKI